jgi:hypothetical protein
VADYYKDFTPSILDYIRVENARAKEGAFSPSPEYGKDFNAAWIANQQHWTDMDLQGLMFYSKSTLPEVRDMAMQELQKRQAGGVMKGVK